MPITKRPTGKPSQKPTPKPTLRPIEGLSSPTQLGGIIYYPDLVLGVCKSDGNHGSIPYTFSSPEACCTNNLMDYNVCMAYATSVPKQYMPNPWVGYCEQTDGTENSQYIFDSMEDCCESGVVGDYDECMENTLNKYGEAVPVVVTPSPTKRPTPKPAPVVESLPGDYYPDFAAGYCKSDGGHVGKPYVFTSAEKCCRNAVMNYDDCLATSIERFQEAPPTTPP
jgi:hypothetical protein